LEIQQRSVEFANLLALGELKSGVLERMPAPELKATVMGYGSSQIMKATVRLLNLEQEIARTSQSDPLKVVTCWVGTTSQALLQTQLGCHRSQLQILKTCSTRSLVAPQQRKRHR
jgi:hypothetical protein